MLRAGATGYILKDGLPEQLVEAQYVDLLTRVQAAGGPGRLTEKERHYIQLLGEGCKPAPQFLN